MATLDKSGQTQEGEPPLVFLPLPEVLRRVGLSERTVYRMESEGTFPKKVPIIGRRVAWIESEVLEWQQQVLRKAGRA